jgi:LmbE family N-acetylglucosaminyl deacetylase
MAEKRVALAVGAHPDDVEFLMAGTLSLLAKAGFQAHILTVANGSCGTAEHGEKEIIRIRRAEARRAAARLGAVYHPGLVNDLMVYYEDSLVRKATAIVRELKPDIVLLPSLSDYMEDHTNSARVIVTACFCRGMRNYLSFPPRQPTFQDVCLYHAQPWHNRDGMRNLVIPALVVDIASEMELKEEMLRCHASQKNWLDTSQGQDAYLLTMRQVCREIARIARQRGLQYAEGFRQHNFIGFSAKDRDLLSEALGSRVRKVRRAENCSSPDG